MPAFSFPATLIVKIVMRRHLLLERPGHAFAIDIAGGDRLDPATCRVIPFYRVYAA